MSEPKPEQRRGPGRPRTARLVPTKRGQSARIWVEEEGEKVRRQVPLGTRSRVVANAKRRRLLAGENPSLVAAQGESFEAAARRIVEASTIKTKKARLSRLERFAFPLFGDRAVTTITVSDVNDALDEMRSTRVGGKITGSIRHLKNDLSAVLGPLFTLGIIGENAAKRIAFRKKDGTLGGQKIERVRKKPLQLSDEEFSRLIAFGLEKGEGVLSEIYMLCLVARSVGGARGSDCHAWRWEHIDIESWQTAWVPRPKTGDDDEDEAGARHALPEAVVPHLVGWWRRHGCPSEGPVFPVRRGKRAGEHKLEASHAQALRDELWEARIVRAKPGYHRAKTDEARKSLCELQTGNEKRGPVTFHAFRGAYSTATSRAKELTPWQAMALTNHKDAPTYQRYYDAAEVLVAPPSAIPPIPSPQPRTVAVPGYPSESSAESSSEAILARPVPLTRTGERGKSNDSGRARKDSNLRPLASEDSPDRVSQPFSADLVNSGHLEKHEESSPATTRRQNSVPLFEGVDEHAQRAIASAIAEGDLDTAAALLEVLRRRKAPAPSNVSKLDDARAKRPRQ